MQIQAPIRMHVKCRSRFLLAVPGLTLLAMLWLLLIGPNTPTALAVESLLRHELDLKFTANGARIALQRCE
jgi:hypothetical protein